MKFFQNIIKKFTGRPVDWDELEENLIRSDIGVPMTLRIIKRCKSARDDHDHYGKRHHRSRARGNHAHSAASPAPIPRPLPAKPKAILIVGVNGTGKTTSTAKLAQYFNKNRHSVMLAAADTFRAAAIEQLGIWAERLGVEMISGQYNADPAALCYEAYQAADKRNTEFLLCDTAGRLHTKTNLDGRVEQGETHHSPNTTRPRRRKRCSWWMRPPAATRSRRRANFIRLLA